MKLKNTKILLSIIGTGLPIVLLFQFLAPGINWSAKNDSRSSYNTDRQIQQAKAGNLETIPIDDKRNIASRAFGFTKIFSVLDNSVIRNSDGIRNGLNKSSKTTANLPTNNCELKTTDRRLPLEAGKKDHIPGSFEHIN
ncbi:MAG: hypothetical protein CVU11_14610 [Bacteroidetes bacterium HGW-Bacteroidetes-6]|jgi:hypothetical protein|nr:MAG: hypothetical protein CVU11_14610 [Bacteroidetes bacterium HGW-Bacteroidetes-6]